MTVGADGGSSVECTHRASIRFGSLDFTIGRESNTVRVLVRPAPSESLNAILAALSTLSLATRMRCRRPRSTSPSEADKKRRQIAIHMRQIPHMMICQSFLHPTQSSLCRVT